MKRLLGALALLIAAPAAADPLVVTSPDGANSVTIGVAGPNAMPTYSVARRGQAIIALSPIVLDLDADSLGYGMAITGTEESSADTGYQIALGKAAQGRDHYNQRIVHFQERWGSKRRMDVVVRAYDDGIAFRTIVPVQPATAAAIVRYDRTGFYFPEAWKCWGFKRRQVRIEPRRRVRSGRHHAHPRP